MNLEADVLTRDDYIYLVAFIVGGLLLKQLHHEDLRNSLPCWLFECP